MTTDNSGICDNIFPAFLLPLKRRGTKPADEPSQLCVGWRPASFLARTCDCVASCLLTPFAFNLPLPEHVNTALMLVPSRAALRPRRFPYFRLNKAVVKMLMATKIKDVAKGSYKTRRLLHFLLFGLSCSLSLRIGKGKSFYYFFLYITPSVTEQRSSPHEPCVWVTRVCEVTHGLGLFDLGKEIFSW